ncbi:rod shape-determining protein MreC [Peribacillus sp. B-H-3]|jgi:rod shape-determining protein MreC|uniref:rod shape-determining protein MreC n=1 Tax=Bacillaceae TaxID=186817 RepID=UPI0008E2F62E|nr:MULTISPECIES: rod shape-determining protein MreC [unclassified Bacillus (in: firmicutes)]OIK14336.1 rod shape-determining protein MreC [Bacillus sp. MUM 13]SFC54333.1 rod shape-determining protein MreC [Bacillus sp. OV322]
MPQFFFNKRLILLLVSIIILVALIGFSLRERSKLTWPEQFLKDTSGFFENIFDKPVSAVSGLFSNVSDLQHTYDENKRLKSRLDEYVQIKTEVQALEKENKDLRKIIGKEDDLRKFSPIQATVIGRNPSRWHEMITINQGKLQGVEKDMAVVTAEGLIGKVKSANNFTSSVQLLTSIDPENRISAIVQGDKDAYGVIEGYDNKRDLLLMKRIPYDKKIKKNSNVITSGFGGVFPSGQLIGKVVDVKIDQYGLNQTAYIEPSTDFYDINNVMVLKRDVRGAE